jgi:hypothetical protein
MCQPHETKAAYGGQGIAQGRTSGHPSADEVKDETAISTRPMS